GPAGRMERGEGIAAALRREVREESGLLCEPLTLLALEERGPAWIRFAFLARATGGCPLGLPGARGARGERPQVAPWWGSVSPGSSMRVSLSPASPVMGISVPCQPHDGKWYPCDVYPCPLPAP
ncbi:PREDICTED: 8-oxo-dGDP phosphatase NUDT18, partial [Ficedula albicollis]|uniref:8-oxo-dGDP phosphatase NUDT18 n=1 Tax=Ficedula albicollis TaxID=59894 RepID=UPI0007AD94B0